MAASIFRWINHNGARPSDVGVLEDGSLHNPRGYPEDVVRAAMDYATEHQRERKSRAAQQAAQTRKLRRDLKVETAAARLALRLEAKGPRSHCQICGRGLE